MVGSVELKNLRKARVFFNYEKNERERWFHVPTEPKANVGRVHVPEHRLPR